MKCELCEIREYEGPADSSVKTYFYTDGDETVELIYCDGCAMSEGFCISCKKYITVTLEGIDEENHVIHGLCPDCMRKKQSDRAAHSLGDSENEV